LSVKRWTWTDFIPSYTQR